MKDGYYWIRLGNEWVIAEYDEEDFVYTVTGSDYGFMLEDIDEVGDFIEIPNKYKGVI